ncbi:hypothetical protein CHI12_09455 [Terribacillus saccharophilus]|uniref:Uncharacterized protein n=1 Tax=Terribacillus saccharophilus TaxID=361277 RepID=A0A268HD33_9BACI|nr:hypothetical protein [Terribacillus saccharophilus]PAE07783.1 hypothetical protein CHI12_09455 [Terribacillus saccharophilus]
MEEKLKSSENDGVETDKTKHIATAVENLAINIPSFNLSSFNYAETVKLATAIPSYVKEAANAANTVLSIFSKHSNSLSNLLKNIDSTTATVLNSYKLMRANMDTFLDTEEDLQLFIEAMVGLGYPPHLGLDINKITNIAAFIRSTDKQEALEEIDEIMTYYYDNEELNNIAKRWEELDHIKSSISILRDIIMAHNSGLYNLSVPSTIILFEGVVMEAFNVEGRTSNVMLGKLIEVLYSDWSFMSYDEQIRAFYEAKVKESFERGKVVGSDISRNAILHGYDKSYGVESVSLKAILFLDQLIESTAHISEEQRDKAAEIVNEMQRNHYTKEELIERDYEFIGNLKNKDYYGNYDTNKEVLTYHIQKSKGKFYKNTRKIFKAEIDMFEPIMESRHQETEQSKNIVSKS